MSKKDGIDSQVSALFDSVVSSKAFRVNCVRLIHKIVPIQGVQQQS